MGYRVAMRVLDPGPTGNSPSVVLSRKGKSGLLDPPRNMDQFTSSYTASFAGSPPMRRATSVAAMSAKHALGIKDGGSPLTPSQLRQQQQQQQQPQLQRPQSLTRLDMAQDGGAPAAARRSSSAAAPMSGSRGQATAAPAPATPTKQHATVAQSMPRPPAGVEDSEEEVVEMPQRDVATAQQQRALLELLANPQLEKETRKMFVEFDTDRSGHLDFKELLCILERLHSKFGIRMVKDDNQCERLFKKYDVRHDQHLDFEEFYDLLLAMLRETAFSARDVVSREFFITKASSKVWHDWEKLKQLGSGTFGTAYLCKNRTGEDCVVKAVKKSRVKIPIEDVEREILVMRQIDHPHVVRLFKWYEDRRRIYLCMEAIKGGTLKDVSLEYQKARKGLKEEWIREVTRQVISALAYCHSLRMIHKDIKDENIMLLKQEGKFDKPFAIVIDLGVSEMFALSDPTGREVGGTPVTMAPEVWSNSFGPKCDVWSVGVVLFEMLTGTFPFMATSMNGDAWIRLHRRGPDWNSVKSSATGRSLCQAMLTFHDARRPTMAKCLTHDWFTSTEKHKLTTVTPAQFLGLQAFCKESDVKRTLLLEVASRLPVEKAQDIVQIFERVDANGDGRLSRHELQDFFADMGIRDEEMIAKLFRVLDVDGNNELSFSEFSACLLTLFKDLLEDRLETLIAEYDNDGDGSIDRGQAAAMMHSVAAALGKGDDELAVLGKRFATKDAKLSYGDFRAGLLQSSRSSSRRSTAQSNMMVTGSGMSGRR
eukprot:TRINITY_DN9680_c1_g2_i1.p1 TRINITY_DN9680_c1_g2~~TRINITY_DN9680_c1_g2_i1.p1  ORF type:complete len:765 (-),score=180.00 TRINITY_DN9680_c1_g2_i1:71-2365(-)